jgi:hypothetical protein
MYVDYWRLEPRWRHNASCNGILVNKRVVRGIDEGCSVKYYKVELAAEGIRACMYTRTLNVYQSSVDFDITSSIPNKNLPIR